MSYSSGTYHETYVFTGQFDDQISAPVDQASISMDKAGDSATNMASQIKGATEAISSGFDRVNQSAGRADAGTASFNRLQRALEPTAAAVRVLQRNLDELDNRFSNQKIAPEQYYDVHAAGVAKLEAARAKMEALRNEAYQTAATLGKVASEQQTSYSKYFSSAQPALVAAARAEQGQTQDIVNRYAGVQAPPSETGARAADIRAYGEALDATRAKYDPLFRASKQYETQLNEISEAQKAGALTADQAAAAQERVTRAFAEANQPLKGFTQNLEDTQTIYSKFFTTAEQAVAAVERAAQAQQTINQSLNVKTTNQDDYAKRSADVEAYGQSLDALRAKYDPVFRVSKEYETALAAIDEAQKVGAISAGTAAEAQDRATAAFQKATGTVTDLEARQIALAQANEKVAASVKYAADYQQAINQSLGVKQTSQDGFAKRADDIQAYGSQLDALRAKFDPVFAASKQYEAQLDEISQAQKVGAISAREAETAQEKLTAEFAAANAPLRNIDSALEAGQQKFKALQAAVDPLGFALGHATAQLADLNAQIAAAEPNQQKYTELLPAAEQRVAQLTKQHDQFLTSINKVDPLTKSAAQGIRFMSTQWIDVVQQLAVGQNPLQVLLQQGGQVLQIAAMTDIGVKGIAKAIAGWAASAAGLTTIIGGSLVAAVGAFALVTEKHNRALLESQRVISLTHDNYVQLGVDAETAAKAIARTTSASLSDARATTTAIAASANWAGTAEQLQRVGTVAVQLDQRLGKAGEGFKLLSAALEDPGKVAQKLADEHFPRFNQELARTIERMQASGDKGLAFGQVLKTLQGESDKTAGKFETPLKQSLEALGKSFTNLEESVKGFSETVGTFVIDQLAGGIKTITGYIESIKQLFDSIKQIYQQIIDLYNKLPIPKGFPSLGETLRNSLPTTNFLPSNPLSSLFSPSTSDVQQQIRDAAAQRNFSPENTDLALSIARQESGFQQYNRFGGVLTSSSGAQGIFQLMPGAASDVHADATNPQQNIGGGLDYIKQQIKDFGSDPAVVALAYAWGPGNTRQFLDGVKTLGDIPQGKKDYVKAVTGKGVGDIRVSSSSIIDISGGASDRTGGANQRIDIDALIKDARGSGINREGIENAADAVQRYSAGLKQLREDGITSGKSVEILNQALQHATDNYNHLLNPLLKDTEALQDETKVTREVGKANQDLIAIRNAAARARQTGNGPSAAQEEAQVAALTERQSAAFAAQTDEININTDAINKQAAAWTDGAAAAALATAKATAHKQVLDTLASSTHDTAKAEAERTQKILESAAAQERLKAGQELNQLGDQIAQIRLENDTLGQDNDTRALTIQHLKDEQAVRRDYAASIALGDTALAQSVLAQRDAVAQMESNLRARTRDFDEISGAIGSAFDNIGNSIAQAFIQGEGSAVNFLNVMKSVAASIIQEFIKLAAINPLRNLLFGGEGGQTLPTITSVFNSLGQSQIASGQVGFLGQGIFGTSQAEARLNAYNAEFASPLGASYGDINAGNFGPGSGVLPSNTPGATGLLGGASIGSVLGGVIGGFSLGAGIGNITQSALGKTGPAPYLGAGAGALAGAAIGSIIPGIGTVVGGLIGGVVGGAGGGFIGPKPPSPYAATFVSIGPNGELVANSGLSGNQITQSNLGAIQQQAAQFNKQQSALGVKIIGTGAPPPAGAAGGLGFFGTAKNPQGLAGENITDAFSNLRFGASSGTPPQSADILNRYINTKAFSAFDDLGKAVDKVRTFIEQTVPSLLKLAGGTGTLDEAIKNLDNQFAAAIQTAQELGYSETDLVAARDKAIQNAKDAVTAQLGDIQSGLDIRYAAASAALSGNPQEALAAQLQAFDVGADQFRKQTSKTWTDALTDSIKTSDGYIAQMASVERTLGQERLAIAKQANDAIKQQDEQAKAQREAQMEQARGTGAQLITSIRDYAHGLQYSQQSPLSPQQMFAQAQRDFNAVSGAAAAGDATSLAKVTSYSDTLLQSARALYGSGQGYANVFKQVTDTLARIGEVNPDTLTASVFALETRTQTTALTTALAELKAELAGIRAQLASGSAMPARLAA